MVVKTPRTEPPAAAVDQGDASPPVASSSAVMIHESCEPDDDAGHDQDAGSALAKELDRERNILVPWLPRFDELGKLIEEEPGGCPWAGLSDAGRAELFRAALEKLPPTHQMLLRLSLSEGPEAEAVAHVARCRLAVHHSVQAILYLARGLRDGSSGAATVARD